VAQDTSAPDTTSDLTKAKSASSDRSSDILPPLPSLPTPGNEMAPALSAFTRTLSRTWKPVRFTPPRGTILLSGLVEIQGSRAIAVVDVRAAYNPKESKWEGVGLGVRRFQYLRQPPRGGP